MVKKIYNITIINKTTKKENECDIILHKEENELDEDEKKASLVTASLLGLIFVLVGYLLAPEGFKGFGVFITAIFLIPKLYRLDIKFKYGKKNL